MVPVVGPAEEGHLSALDEGLIKHAADAATLAASTASTVSEEAAEQAVALLRAAEGRLRASATRRVESERAQILTAAEALAEVLEEQQQTNAQAPAPLGPPPPALLAEGVSGTVVSVGPEGWCVVARAPIAAATAAPPPTAPPR